MGIVAKVWRQAFTAVGLLLASGMTLAAGLENAAAQVEQPVSTVWVALFLIGFIGLIIGFVVYVWWKHRQGAGRG